MRSKIIFMIILLGLCGFIFLMPDTEPDAHLPSYDNRMQEDHAPTPFTSKEIAEACSTGLEMKYMIEQKGKAPFYQITWFTNSDSEGTDFEATTTDLDGNILQEQTAHATWLELQAHASFPEKDCVINLATIELEMSGKLHCWLYTVKKDGGISKLWFARNLPGPPVLFEQYKGGKRVYRMSLVRNSYLDELEDSESETQ